MNNLLRIIADSSSELRALEDGIKDRLFSSPWFCYKYQVHRLRNIAPCQLGADLSGSAEGGLIAYSPAAAAELLCAYSKNTCKWVVRVREDFPFTEGNLRFVTFHERRLPYGRPVLFKGKLGFTIDALAQQNHISLGDAARLLIETVENE